MKRRTWAQHWARGPLPIAARFNEMSPLDAEALMTGCGFSLAALPRCLNSVENRIFSCVLRSKEQLVLKCYRPFRWSLSALKEEAMFLRDAKAQGVCVVRPRRLPKGGEIGTWRGIFFMLFKRENVIPRPPGPFNEQELLELGRLAASLHVAAMTRPARHRMTIDAHAMGHENLRLFLKKGLLPSDLLADYEKAALEIIERGKPLLADVPVFRQHGDFGVHNLLWTDRGIVILDFDDFMMGPAAFDLCRLYVGITTVFGDPEKSEQARDRATALFIQGYRELLPLPDKHIAPIHALRALRMIYNDAWKCARLHDGRFCETRKNIYDRNFWLVRLQFLKAQANRLWQNDRH